VRRSTLIFCSLCVTFLLTSCTTAPPPASNFRDDWVGLFLAVTKSFGTRTYYVGSDVHWAYFETPSEDSLFTPTYRKVEASRLHIARPFPLDQGKPYRIELRDFVGYEK